MTSRSLCFKLIKEDVKRRLWMLCLFALGLFFMFPVTAAFEAGIIREMRTPELGLYHYVLGMEQWMSFKNAGMAALVIIGAVIAGMSSFSYLNSKSKVDFYHGISVRRELLYISNNISGVLMFAVPYAIMLGAGIAVAVGNGVEFSAIIGTAARAYGLNLIYFILLYATAVAAAMLTGNLIVGILGTGVFYFFGPIAAAMVSLYFTTFFANCTTWRVVGLTEPWYRLSPFYEYIYRITEEYAGTLGTAGVALDFLAAMALVFIGCILYRKRPSETAGKAMAFSVSCPIIRIPIVFLTSAFIGLFFWSMRATTGWALFGLICGGVISHCIIEIIYHFDFKKMFSHWKQLLACLAAATIFLLVFRFDWLGYDTYLPDGDAVVSADVMIPDLNYEVSYGELMQDEEGRYLWESKSSSEYVFDHSQNLPPDVVRRLAEKAIRQQQEDEAENSEKSETVSEREYSDDELWGSVEQQIYTGMTIRYNLTGGRQVYRSYYSVPLELVKEELEEIYASEGFMRASFPVMELKPSAVKEVRYCENESGRDIIPENLSDEELAEILTAYQQDFAELTIEQMQNEVPVGTIRFVDSEMKKALEWRDAMDEAAKYDDNSYQISIDDYRMRLFKNKEYYPVYRSFKRVCSLLEKQGIRPGERTILAPVSRIRIDYYGKEELSCNISDEKEIQELMKLIEPSASYFNPFFDSEQVDITVTASYDGKEYSYAALIKRGTLPEFVKERLKAED